MAYFDNAATSHPKPEAVAKAVYDAILTMGNAHRGAYEQSLLAARLVFSLREKLAAFFGVEKAENVAFTSNATESLNAVINSFITKDSHVIATVSEHNSVLRPLYKSGAKLSIIGCDKNGVIRCDELEKVIGENTTALICSHASNVTGNIIDIDYISKLCRKHNILFIVDAAQTSGFLPINMTESEIDVLCFTGHKSLLGPQGTGGICINTSKNIKLWPYKSGGSGSNSFSKEHPDSMPGCFEAGTLNVHSLAGLNAAIDYINSVGLSVIAEKESNLAALFYNELKDIDKIKFYGDYGQNPRCPIVAFNIADYNAADVAAELYEKHGIAIRAGAHCSPLMHEAFGTKEQGIVRFSFSHFNTKEEVSLASLAVKEIINT